MPRIPTVVPNTNARRARKSEASPPPPPCNTVVGRPFYFTDQTPASEVLAKFNAATGATTRDRPAPPHMAKHKKEKRMSQRDHLMRILADREEGRVSDLPCDPPLSDDRPVIRVRSRVYAVRQHIRASDAVAAIDAQAMKDSVSAPLTAISDALAEVENPRPPPPVIDQSRFVRLHPDSVDRRRNRLLEELKRQSDDSMFKDGSPSSTRPPSPLQQQPEPISMDSSS